MYPHNTLNMISEAQRDGRLSYPAALAFVHTARAIWALPCTTQTRTRVPNGWGTREPQRWHGDDT